MSVVFNPFTGTFDFTGSGGGGGSTLTKKQVIKAILVESNQNLDLPVAAILFDNDSILFNDDEEL
jgi:hypothetical protein